MQLALGLFLATFALLFFMTPAAQEAVLMFIVAGVIPGTGTAIHPLLMLGLLLLGLAFTLFWVRRQTFYEKMRDAHRPTSAAPVKKPRKKTTGKKLAEQTS